MKSVKIAFAAIVLAGGIVAAFAFKAPKTIVPDTWFEFTGNPASLTDIKNPAKYQLLPGDPGSTTPDNVLQAIQVEAATEIYPTGHAQAGLPKVNVALSQLQIDILDATGNDATHTVNELPGRVYLKP